MTWEMGSTWGKWDLHVHTPESFAHGYPGPHEEAWERFLADLEALPPEFRVLGISDYIFLDGYRRLVTEKQQGRLANIETLLPVIELRVDKFGGTAGHLSRVNFHAIFSETLGADFIEHHFINALTNWYQLAPQYQGQVEWKALPTKKRLTDLGRKIKLTVPEDQLEKFRDDLTEGFNGFNVPLNSVLDVLRRPDFKGKSLSAVGKTEWADIKWNDQSIAEKKNSINSVDLVFIAADSPEHWRKNQKNLAEAQVNARLFDCSDAHHLSISGLKERVGNCFTWVNAVPTFAGLRRALFEYDDRVFLGDEPPLLKRERPNPTRSVVQLDIFKAKTADPSENWFQTSLPINPGFVAIIGNKGQGKSALADILVLVSAYVGAAILIEASLSFLGLGTQPPNPSWGLMLAGTGRRYMEEAPWMAIFPGLAISLTVLAFNMLGDILRDMFDPRLRAR